MRRLTTGLIAGSLLVVAACGSDDDIASTGPEAIDEGTDSADGVDGVDDVETSVDDAPPDSSPATDPPDTTVLPTTAPEEAPVETDAPEPTLAELPSVGMGDYEVGVRTITITDAERDRPLDVDVWFPLSPDTEGEPHRYTFVTGDYYESPEAITADAAAISADGPFPLVVYSHGSGGTRYIHSNYTETLASHGYLVVAPDHTGNTAVERILETSDDRSTIALNRPRDVRTVIDAMLNPESTETAGFVASVNPEQIAVTGHSFGGFTTYAVASGYSNELGEVAPDPRVDAIIPIAPSVGGDDQLDEAGEPVPPLLSDDRLEAITVPALVIVGTDDRTTPVDPHVERAWTLTRSEPSYRLELVAAEHQTFTDVCAYLDFFPTLPDVDPLVIGAIEPLAEEGCSADDMPIPRAQDLTNTFAVTFLDSIFDGGGMITPDAFVVPDDVIYQVK